MAPRAKKIVAAATARGPRGGPSTVAGLDAHASPDATAGFAPAELGRAALPVRQVRVPAVATIAVAAFLCCAGPVVAQETPPPATTTVSDAPPPEPYRPPVPAVKPKPKRAAPRPVGPVTRAPSYTPPAVTPRPAVRAPAAKPQRKARIAKKPRRALVHKTRPKSETPALAPVAHVLSAVSIPVIRKPAEEDPYLWLAGVSFAAVAVAGSSLLRLTLRSVVAQ